MVLRRLLSRKERKVIKQELKVKEKHNLEIRDSLAMERTKLANERTFLAYVRSAIGMVLAGLTFMKIFEDPAYIGLGLIFIPVGLGVGYFGYYRFSKKKAEILRYTHEYVPTSPVLAEVTAQDERDTSP
ncbi:DUF202 domain-containing protein [Botryobacter ruber]|uniref:DUF202 domain-containing protein n=1 Tax=Botryobacter ruber TaxID=2171629 RepID=UPI000E0BCA91|nr:DUF202 domain-containing protein [Botryobacter ruber]